jgi:hypothetical protein
MSGSVDALGAAAASDAEEVTDELWKEPASSPRLLLSRPLIDRRGKRTVLLSCILLLVRLMTVVSDVVTGIELQE